ncbi:50S ribosomal protein L21 [Buchnera aphidicola]|uniref:50S ribosomal protein L21 n=1 Tax=Buchnera aphidicola TaxID=9 RepID=UPI003463F1F3
MYAIFEHGGKQYQVKKGQNIKIEKINLNPGENINFYKIIMVIEKEKIKIGQPHVQNTNITGNIIQHGKHKKIKIIKFKRRKHHQKQQGHRQNFTEIKIININTSIL